MLIRFAHECDILPSLQNSLFDHKAVYVNFFVKKSPGQRTTIAASVLKDPMVDLLVKASVAECYIHHVLIPNEVKKAKLAEIGRIRNLVKTAGPDLLINNVVGWDDSKDLIRANIIADISQRLEDINIDELESMEKDIEDDIFLEYLVNCVRNDVTSLQIFCSKSASELKSKLISELSSLRNNIDDNCKLIEEKEHALNAIVDSQMKNEFEKFRHYDILNSEKITQSFLKLLKGSNRVGRLRDIYNEMGEPFTTANESERFIVDYFKKIYKKPNTEPSDLSGCIDEFLGPEILKS